jgi:hypothetical protein
LRATSRIDGDFAANSARHAASFSHTNFAWHFFADRLELGLTDGAACGVRNHASFAFFDGLTGCVRNFDSLAFFHPFACGVRDFDSLAFFDPCAGCFRNLLGATFFHPVTSGVRHFDGLTFFHPCAACLGDFLGDGARNLTADRVRNFLVTNLLFVTSAANRFLDDFRHPDFATDHFRLWSTTVG